MNEEVRLIAYLDSKACIEHDYDQAMVEVCEPAPFVPHNGTTTQAHLLWTGSADSSHGL